MDITIVAALRYLLDEAGRMLLSENLIIVGIVIWSVKGHFKRLELGLHDMNKSVSDLTTEMGKYSAALLGVETKHSDRLNVIEKRVDKLEEHTTQRRPITGDL